MARRVFFSFHYQQDYWRVNQVRNSWVLQREDNKKINSRLFMDGSMWEEVKKQGDKAIKDAINLAMNNTSVTVVLIGQHTHQRKYVQYEIEKSQEDNNKGLLGVYIHSLKDSDGNGSPMGLNPLPNEYPTYWWFNDDGYNNFSDWVEAAAKAAGR
jgi:hypothetical protein